MPTMARLQFGPLREAWKGEASDFTPLLAEQLDALGSAIGIDLAALGKSEVPTTGGRRIDIVALADDGAEFVIENQYGRADHDHLTRGLAYAVARRARGLVVVAEEHRDEFRAVAAYLNELSERDPERRGIAVWLVEAKAVRIEASPWAPLFTAVVEPNDFIATFAPEPGASRAGSLEELWAEFESAESLAAAQGIVSQWLAAGHRTFLGPDHVVLYAPGPSKNGLRSCLALYTDGRVRVPFNAYRGGNTGISIDALTSDGFRARTNILFSFDDGRNKTAAGWLTSDRVPAVLQFCEEVANAYAAAVDVSGSD